MTLNDAANALLCYFAGHVWRNGVCKECGEREKKK